MLLTEQLVEPVLPLDQELQAALAIFDVEGKEDIPPTAEGDPAVCASNSSACAVGARVDDALAHRPGVDDLGHHGARAGTAPARPAA